MPLTSSVSLQSFLTYEVVMVEVMKSAHLHVLKHSHIVCSAATTLDTLIKLCLLGFIKGKFNLLWLVTYWSEILMCKAMTQHLLKLWQNPLTKCVFIVPIGKIGDFVTVRIRKDGMEEKRGIQLKTSEVVQEHIILMLMYLSRYFTCTV